MTVTNAKRRYAALEHWHEPTLKFDLPGRALVDRTGAAEDDDSFHKAVENSLSLLSLHGIATKESGHMVGERDRRFHGQKVKAIDFWRFDARIDDDDVTAMKWIGRRIQVKVSTLNADTETKGLLMIERFWRLTLEGRNGTC